MTQILEKVRNVFFCLFAAGLIFAGCSVTESTSPEKEAEEETPSLEAVTIEAESETISATGSTTLTAKPTTKGNPAPSVTYKWEISSGKGATLSSGTGSSVTVTGCNESTTQAGVIIKLTATYGSTTKTDTKGITVEGKVVADQITGVTISGTSAIEAEGTATLTAQASSEGNPEIEYTWTITAVDGTAITAGTSCDYAKITVSSSDTSGATAVLTGTSTDSENRHTVTVTVSAKNKEDETNIKSDTHTVEVYKAGERIKDEVTAVTIVCDRQYTLPLENGEDVPFSAVPEWTGDPEITYAWEITEGSGFGSLLSTEGEEVIFQTKNDTASEGSVTLKVTATGTSTEDGESSATDTITFTVEKTTLSSIEVTSAATKTTFEAGDTFDASGIKLKANYSNGTSRTNLDPTSVNAPDMDTAGTKTVTVTYSDDFGEAEVTYTITVTAKPQASFTLTYAGPAAGSDVSIVSNGTTLTASAPATTGTYTWAWYVDWTVRPAFTSNTVNISELSLSTGTTYAIVVTATDSATGVIYSAQYELTVN